MGVGRLCPVRGRAGAHGLALAELARRFRRSPLTCPTSRTMCVESDNSVGRFGEFSEFSPAPAAFQHLSSVSSVDLGPCLIRACSAQALGSMIRPGLVCRSSEIKVEAL